TRRDFWRVWHERAQVLFDPVRRQPDRILGLLLRLERASRRDVAVARIDDHVADEARRLTDEREEALLGTLDDFIHRARVDFVGAQDAVFRLHSGYGLAHSGSSFKYRRWSEAHIRRVFPDPRPRATG